MNKKKDDRVAVERFPVVVKTMEVVDFLQLIIRHAPLGSHLIVCTEEEEFLHQVLASISFVQNDAEADDHSRPEAQRQSQSRNRHPLLIPTLRHLNESRHIKVTFCASLDVLKAYLACDGRSTREKREKERLPATTISSILDCSYLILLNLLQSHLGTASFSAQGLSRTLASAVDAASTASMRLIIFECPSRLEAQDEGQRDYQAHHDSSSQMGDMEGDHDEQRDPWDQTMPMLNPTTRSFGAGSRAWAGRTVSARQVAARWCVFEDWSAKNPK